MAVADGPLKKYVLNLLSWDKSHTKCFLHWCESALRESVTADESWGPINLCAGRRKIKEKKVCFK